MPQRYSHAIERLISDEYIEKFHIPTIYILFFLKKSTFNTLFVNESFTLNDLKTIKVYIAKCLELVKN